MKLMHNVFFALKDKSPEAVKALVDACKKYLTIQPGIVSFAAGGREPGLTREVNVPGLGRGTTRSIHRSGCARCLSGRRDAQ